jgi:hypothetical protein
MGFFLDFYKGWVIIYKRMNTFKFNTEDTTSGKKTEFPYPKELKEEDRFLAEVLAEIAPYIRGMQAKGKLMEEKRTELLSEIKKLFEQEKE